MFRDWPFLGCSLCISLVTTANFRLFLNAAILLILSGKMLRENAMETEIVFFVNQLEIRTKNLIPYNEQPVAISTVN